MKPPSRAGRIVAFLGLVALASCASDAEDTGRPDQGDLRVEWPPQATPEVEALRTKLQNGAFEDLAARFNERWKLPSDVTVRHETCGVVNAFYRHSDRTLRMCYELYAQISQVFAAPPDADEALRSVLQRRIDGTWQFVFSHELGHAVVALYGLPVLGRNEDAADQYAVHMMIDSGRVDAALSAAIYFGATDQSIHTDVDYADAHELNVQRLATTLCMLYGHDPSLLAEAEAKQLFPQRDCVYEYKASKRDWDRLVADWRR